MISIVVYGRNDNHGYNLHKRAAISINCLAEMLRDPADELIFVDYNSPDDLPTFPEAIRDTLTPRAKAVLRILRVRPDVHRRFQRDTHLPVLEPVARNVGVRASNPANRWVLSTNTDIILVPRRARHLSELAVGLPSGFYHTARFEIPESLWESFERTDPTRTIEDVRALGISARLNEVVYGSDAILYDGPGDFQLVERSDLFEIGGFDERMIRGWHVDSNLAKRWSLKRGAVASLIDEVFCYHCGHTRQATAAHRRERLENDPKRFVDEVARPDLPEQRESWGCAGDAIEEIKLPQDGMSGYRRMLRSVVAPLDQAFTEAAYTAATYDDYGYDPQHVLPFLADLLGCYPRDIRLGWCGARRDMFELLRQAWRHLGFVGPIAVDEASAPRLIDQLSDRDQLRVLSRNAWLDSVDLLTFEFGRASDGGRLADENPQIPGLSREDAEALAVVQSGFLAAVMHERTRLAAETDAAPRRFVGVNSIHNEIEPLFAAHIAATATPFSSRLRHGFVVSAAPELAPETAARLLIGAALGRAEPISQNEFALAREIFGPLLEGAEMAPHLLHRAAVNASFGQAFIEVVGNPSRDGQLPETAQRALARLEKLRPSAELSPRLGLAVDDGPLGRPAERPLSRFAAYGDWDDRAWSAFAVPYATDPRADDAFRRGAGQWEQVQLLYGLDRAGKLTETARMLVIATMPDAAIAAMSRLIARIQVLGVGNLGEGAALTPAFWCAGKPHRGGELEILDVGAGFQRLEQGAYDAVVFPHGSMFVDGLDGALASMEAAERLLRRDGVLVFKAEIAAGAAPHPNFFDTGLVGEEGLPAQLAAYTGFVADGGFDPRLSRATVDRTWPESGSPPTETYFLTRQDGRILIPSLWFLRRHETGGESQWESLRRWLLDRRLGEQIDRLRVGAAGRRDAEGRIGTVAGREGHVFFGPYLAVPSGRYRVTVGMLKNRTSRRSRASGAVLEAAAGRTILASSPFDGNSIKSGMLTMEFEVPCRQAGPDEPLEIRVYSPSDFSATFTSVSLRDIGPARRQAARPYSAPVLPRRPAGPEVHGEPRARPR